MQRCALLLTTSLCVLVLFCSVSQRSICAEDATDTPNILWITSEDNNVNWVGCYGNPLAKTPNIDKLAADGFRYTHCYANVPVCAPQRSTWITGVHAVSMGTQPMRSKYAVPKFVQTYPFGLAAAGYSFTLGGKGDYNLSGTPISPSANKRHKAKKQPRTKHSFDVLNLGDSHESRAFEISLDADDRKTLDQIKLRQYHPDLPTIRENYASYQKKVGVMDAKVGQALAKLKKSGKDKNTIVVYCSDHGGVLPRSKRFLYNSGTHCPLVIRIPEKFKHLWPAEKPGSTVDRIVSFVDMPKTWLSIAGAKVPKTMQGRVFLGKDAVDRDYHFAYRGRMDERLDNVRAVRNKKFVYIKNYMPWAPLGQELSYLWRMPATQAWVKHHKQGKTDAITGRFFKPKAAVEELYDTLADPDNIHNLAADPKYSKVLAELRSELRKRQHEFFDSGLIPETERVRLSKKHGTTIYQAVRKPKLYNLAGYLDAADLALAAEATNLEKLKKNLASEELGVRYWGIVGMFMLDKDAAAAKPAITKAMSDPSHEIRAMAAWTLLRQGDKKAGYGGLGKLLAENTYAMLSVLNIVDWLGEDGQQLLPAVKATQLKENYAQRMKATLVK
jgi:N-sulfoglucosamine sulfohydrolase